MIDGFEGSAQQFYCQVWIVSVTKNCFITPPAVGEAEF